MCFKEPHIFFKQITINYNLFDTICDKIIY